MKRRYQLGESGFYLPFLAITLVSLLLVIGLTIDGGHAFLRQVRLQRAVDAGTIAAMQELNRRPSLDIQSIADRVARENMVRAGLADDLATADINVNVEVISDNLGRPINNRLEVMGRALSPTSFLQLIPGIPYHVQLSANSIAGVPPIAVLLVLDRSGSMGELMNGVRKIDALRAAASQFVSLLDSGDWFGVVSYANRDRRVTVNIPLQLYHPADFAAHQQAINQIVANGGTCIACGLVTGRQQFAAAPAGFPSGVEKVMIVMTDGTPQHFRRPIGDNDDVWLSELPGMHENASVPPLDTGCGHVNFRIRSPQRPHPYSPAGTWNAVTPGNNDQVLMGGTGDIYRTIWQTDQARREGIKVYTVGLGNDGTHFCRTGWPIGSTVIPPEPPWQPQGCFDGDAGGADATTRPYLLRRMANDAAVDMLCDQSVEGGCEPPAAPPFLPLYSTNPENNYQDFDLFPHCRPAIGMGSPRGMYLEAPSPGDLVGAFYQVFLEIKKPRLVD